MRVYEGASPFVPFVSTETGNEFLPVYFICKFCRFSERVKFYVFISAKFADSPIKNPPKRV